MADGIEPQDDVGAVPYNVARDDTLVYVTGGTEVGQGVPVWVRRDGREEPLAGAPETAVPQSPRLSPDGSRLAQFIANDLWVYEINGRPPIRTTFPDGPRNKWSPVWTPDGKRLVYEATNPRQLEVVAADGSQVKPDVFSPPGHFHPHGFSPDGRRLLAVEVTGGSSTGDLIEWPVDEPSARRTILNTPAGEGFFGMALSPDGRWLAYASDQIRAERPEIWVRPYVGEGPAVRISPSGGTEPTWSRSGDELYYLQDETMMAVAITPGAQLSYKPPVPLFEFRYATFSQPPSYDVAPDGRFVVIKPRASGTGQASRITVVDRWTSDLKPDEAK